MTANVRRAVMGQQDAIARELRMCEGLLHSLGTAVARGVHSPSPSRAERKLECPGAPMRKAAAGSPRAFLSLFTATSLVL